MEPSGHPTLANLKILQQAVEVAARAAKEAGQTLNEVSEEKRAVNGIPKGKAGGGKGAKKLANQKYQHARKEVHQRTIDLEDAKDKLEKAEQALEDIYFMQTSNGNDSLDTNGEKSHANPSEENVKSASVERQGQEAQEDHVSLKPCSSGIIIRNHHTHRDVQDHSGELLPNQILSEDNPPSDEEGDSMRQNNNVVGAEVDVEKQGLYVASELGNMGMIPITPHMHPQPSSSELSVHKIVSEDRPSSNEPAGGSVRQNNVLDTETNVAREDTSESGIASQPLHISPLSSSSVASIDDHVPQKGFDEQDTKTLKDKKKLVIATTRVTRSTPKEKAELEGDDAQGTENPHPVIDEEDEWFSLSNPPSDTDEDEEKDRVAEAVKFKHPTPSAEEKRMFRFMGPDDKKEYDQNGRSAIDQYLQDGKEIDAGIRRMARLDPEFLPEAATTSRELALHFLTSREGNIMCGYHAFKNKSTFIRDGWGKPGMKVRGVPGKRKVAACMQKTKNKSTKSVGSLLGNCGCMVHDILLEFALSKVISISGFVNGERQSEKMSLHDYMEPRNRSFAFQAIRLMVPDLSLNDFYNHGKALNHEAEVARKRASYWVKALNYKSHMVASLEEYEEYELSKVTQARGTTLAD